MPVPSPIRVTSDSEGSHRESPQFFVPQPYTTSQSAASVNAEEFRPRWWPADEDSQGEDYFRIRKPR